MCGIIPGYCREMKPPYGMIYHCLVFFWGGEAGNAEQLWYVYIYRTFLVWGFKIIDPPNDRKLAKWIGFMLKCTTSFVGAHWCPKLNPHPLSPRHPVASNSEVAFFRHMLSPAINFTFEISSIFTPTAAVDWLRNQRNSRIPLRATKFCSHLAMLPLKARTYTGPRYGAEIWRYGLV